MISYKDKTFCSSEVEEHICDREITKQQKREAKRLGLLVSYSYFCNQQNGENPINMKNYLKLKNA